MNEQNDQVLIQTFVAGNTKSFDTLYRRHKDKVYARCLNFAGNTTDADDIFQSVWVKVYFHLSSFQYRSQFSTWLFRIVSNESINFLKSKRYMFKLNDETFTTNKDEFIDQTMIKLDVTKAINTLSKEYKAMLLLKYVHGYTYEEIAVMTGLSPSAVKMRIKRSKEKIKYYIK